MDELIHVALLRRGLAADPDLNLAEPARRLDAEISAARARPAAPARSRPRSRRSLAIAGGALAAAAAGAIVVTQSLPGAPALGPARPGHHPAAAAPEPAAAAPGPTAAAAQFVAYATKAASTTTFDPAPDQWVYEKVLTVGTGELPHNGSAGVPAQRFTYERWFSGDGQREGAIRNGKLTIGASPESGGGEKIDGWPQMALPVSYKYLNSLPASPADLTRLIAAANEVDPATVAGGTAVFNAIKNLMINVVLPPQLNATLYGALARLPGVTFDKSVTDASGRTDAGFSTVQEGYLKEEILVSPSTFAYLGLQEIAVKDHTQVALDGTFHIVKGQVLSWEAQLAAGIVSQAGQRP
jgi:hypothetical protein